ncbi:MAG: hypothetical protein E6J45_14080 [Chloroflexi bacterium]|nr:MAG: hypothetical protein E6J45_14080 [Chloroflexota bacterium]
MASAWRRGPAVPLIVLAALAVLAALVTVVVWRLQPEHTGSPHPRASAAPQADFTATDGDVLLVWPRNTKPLLLTVGQRLQILLEREPLQLVSPLDPRLLVKVPDFPCHIAILCGPGESTWSFEARVPGSTTLHIVYGTGCPPGRCLTGTINKPVVIR